MCGELCRRNEALVHVSSGELLRDEIRRGSELGTQLAAQMARGELVAASVVMTLIEESLAARPGRLVLLDGFPRSLQNAIDYVRMYKTCEGLVRRSSLLATIDSRFVSLYFTLSTIASRRILFASCSLLTLFSFPPAAAVSGSRGGNGAPHR